MFKKFYTLPNEVLFSILEFIDNPKDLDKIRLISKRLNLIITNTYNTEYLYKQLYKNTFGDLRHVYFTPSTLFSYPSETGVVIGNPRPCCYVYRNYVFLEKITNFEMLYKFVYKNIILPIISKKQSVNEPLPIDGIFAGYYPLEIAILMQAPKFVEKLLELGAKLEIPGKKIKYISESVKNFYELSYEKFQGYNVLLLAAIVGNTQIFNSMINYCEDATTLLNKETGISGWGCHGHGLIWCNMTEAIIASGNTMMLTLALTHGGKLRFCNESRKYDSLIYLAMRSGNPKMLEYCFERAKEQNINSAILLKRLEGKTPLHNIFRLLWEFEFRITDNISEIKSYINERTVPMVKILINHGASLKDKSVFLDNSFFGYLVGYPHHKVRKTETSWQYAKKILSKKTFKKLQKELSKELQLTLNIKPKNHSNCSIQ